MPMRSCRISIGSDLPPADRVGIYRNTARIGMTEALRLSFPAVERLVGADFFAMAAARSADLLRRTARA